MGKCRLRTVFCGGANPAKVSSAMYSTDCLSSKIFKADFDFLKSQFLIAQ